MNKKSWSDDDRVEYDELITEALATPGSAYRVDRFLDGLCDGEQAQRLWALDVKATLLRKGAAKLLDTEAQSRRPRALVSHDDQIIGTARREVGRKRRAGDGRVQHERALFDYLTWDQLREKIDEFLRNRQALDVDILALRKLLVLEEMVPGAATPAEACEQLGVTVEEFLAEIGGA